MDLKVSGLPLIALSAGFVLVFATPVWIAARMVGANNATLLRSAMALILGTICAVLSCFTGAAALVLVPLSFLLAFKFLLETTLGEAFLLGVLAVLGSALMIKVFGGAVTATLGSGGAV
jgi:hypothetical protein